MSFVLTDQAKVKCPHGVDAVPAGPLDPKVSIAGGQVVTANVPYKLLGVCPNKPPCTAASWQPGSANTRVLVRNQPVVLSTSLGPMVPPTNLFLVIGKTQDKVKGP
ncbi:MAG TPA: hypothetical protein VFF06_24445 [Polyangia bacterium]|nr:hypothetical protein [Polyangia bacterium]